MKLNLHVASHHELFERPITSQSRVNYVQRVNEALNINNIGLFKEIPNQGFLIVIILNQ